MSDAVRSALDELRTKLLDLTGRNRLLNYRHTETARQARFVNTSLADVLKGLEGTYQLELTPLPEPAALTKTISPALAAALEAHRRTDEDYLRALEEAGDDALSITRAEDELLERLCADRGIPVPVVSRPNAPDVARRNGISPEFDLPIGASESASGPRTLQTLLFPDVYERRLSKVREDARSSLQELGINTLYVALGFLEWYEADSSSKAMLSPLVLIPVAIDREIRRGHYLYSISGLGDDPETNVTLAERLRRDFSLSLPSFDPERPLSAFFEEVRDAIREKQRWKIRTFATLGTFNFSRLAIYKDLDPDTREPDQLLENHPIVSALLAGTNDRGDAFAPEPPPEDAFKIALSPHIVTDADSSQLAAIIESAHGRNLVIEGPPGTGKSQTITNLIAAAIGMGKSILFLAEKSAALDVVKNRLTDAGLGDFCLELHSTKARKAEVHESIRQRLRLRADRRADPEAPFVVAKREAETVAQYCEELHRPFGGFKYSLYDLVWRQERLRQELSEPMAALFDSVRIERAESLSAAGLLELTETVAAWVDRRAGLLGARQSLEDHPLSALRDTDFDDAIVQNFAPSVECATSKAQALCAWGKMLEDVYPNVNALTLAQLEQRARFLLAIRDVTTVPSELVQRALPIHDLARAKAHVQDGGTIEARIDECGAAIVESVQGAQADVSRLLSVAESLGESESSNRAVIMDQLRECEAEEARIAALRSLVVELGDITGVAEPDAASFFTAVATLRAIVEHASRQVMHARFPDALDPANLRHSEEICSVAEDLRVKLTEAARIFDLAAPLDLDALRADGRLLKTAGFLWFFDPEIKAARRRFVSMQKLPMKAKNPEIASYLFELADLLERRRAFEVNAENVRILGPLFRGVDTDLNLVRSLSALAGVLDTELAAKSRHGAQLAAFVKRAPVEAIDRLMELSSSARFIDVVAACSQDDTSLSAALQRAQSRTASLRALHGAWSLPQPIANLTLSELRRALDVTIAWAAWERSWIADNELRRLLPIKGSNARAEAIASLDYVAALRNAGSQDEINRLASVEPVLIQRVAAQASSALGDAIADLRQALNGLERTVGVAAGPFEHRTAGEAVRLLAGMRASSHELFDWLQYRHFDREIDRRGLRPFADRLLEAGTECSPATILEFVVIRSTVATAHASSPALRSATGLALSSCRERFAKSDHSLLEQQRRALRNMALDRYVPAGNGSGLRSTWTEGCLIELELGKEKRHIALRDFFNRAGRAVQQLKPCFMMSPLSVSQFLPPPALSFDIVVIDEASQMKPEDALGAISRGKQVIVVGDPKQLPPTSFFDRADQSDVADEDSVDTESILELASQQFGHPRRLLWHYRSRHAGLIAFSNQQFYGGELMLFPSPATDLAGGVSSNYVDGQYRSRVNAVEASAIADAAARFMVEHPELSLAIVTLNQPQRDLIDDEIQVRVLRDPRIAQYCAKWEASLAPFIVKNLETIQGDERDVVFISTVYGRDENGSIFQRFGPINGKSGWRRLNVLFTRAKHRIEVFTSMQPADVHIDERSSEGVRALRGYLEYASSGTLPSGTPTGREPDSDFEISVANVLRARGYQVVPQVGVAGFFVDIGIVDPNNANRYLVGVECDGWAYHSSKSARDRDRLREEVLRRLGWRLIRIWSTDWFTNPRRESERLVSEIRKYEHALEGASGSIGVA